MDAAVLHAPVNFNKPLEEMSPEERMRAEHQLMHEKHKGHEAMHSEMALNPFITLVVAPVILVEWKKRHCKSYSAITLLAMWIIPLIMSIFCSAGIPGLFFGTIDDC